MDSPPRPGPRRDYWDFPLEAPEEEPLSEQWSTVGIFEGVTQNVFNYVDYASWNANMAGDSLGTDNLPILQNVRRLMLQSGTVYKFRVAGINACGKGEYSEVRKSAILSFFLIKLKNSLLTAIYIHDLFGGLPGSAI